MEDDKKKKVVDLFKINSKPKPSPRRKSAAPAGNVIYVNGAGVAVGQLAGGDIHNHVNEKKIVRPKVERGPEYISSAVARRIQKRIDTLVEIGVAAGGETRKLYAMWHKRLKDHFAVPSYLEIPAHLEQHAIDWLQQQKVLQRPKIRRTANDMWRNDHYTGIWSRAKQLGMSKADVYNLALERLGVKVISLKQLGERNLKKLYGIIFSLKAG